MIGVVIPLSRGFVAIVSPEDYKQVSRYKWHTHKGRGQFPYARGVVNGKKIFLHRFLAGLKKGDKRQVDHLNHQTLDCRRENLEVVTAKENARRRRTTINKAA